MKATFQTHVGWVRQVNEDSGTIVKLDQGLFLAILADGMGGHQAGDVASKMAVEIIAAEVKAHWQTKNWEQLIVEAVEAANQQIYELAKQNAHLEGMGTTVEVSLITKEKGLIAHVGDSRVYLFQNPELVQLTDDHTLVYALYKSGQISLAETKNHPQKNFVLRALGTEEKVDIDLVPFSWNRGDRLILCTDGFFNHVEKEKLNKFLNHETPVEELGEELLKYALDLGGGDNISFILIENTNKATEGGIG